MNNTKELIENAKAKKPAEFKEKLAKELMARSNRLIDKKIAKKHDD